MSIIYTRGDVWVTNASVIAHGVNCVGVMGGGVARQVRDRYPRLYQKYRQLCAKNILQPGDVWLWSEPGLPWIANLATQADLQGAQLSWIDESLRRLRLLAESDVTRYRHIAMPQIGAGLGRLEWEDVVPFIERWFADSPTIQVEVVEWAPLPPVETGDSATAKGQ